VALTRCEQIAADLADLLAARKALATGGLVTRVRKGDKETQYSAANIGLLNAEIRRLQALDDACNGRTRGEMPRMAPSDE
jgi:hypothetical protein